MNYKLTSACACGPFTKNKERIQNFMQRENTNYICRNHLDKACSQHDIAYGRYNDLTKRTDPEKVLKYKAIKLQLIQYMTDIKEY